MTVVVGRAVRLGLDNRWIYLEAEAWEALDAIARREGRTVDDLCAAIERTRPRSVALGGSIRLFLSAYHAADARSMSDGAPTAPRWLH
ncbi:ribbon-helix-helix domain-containing protein [Arenibaculum pallidiluteum]|uniref:ribbon-helix-helix domain-containing protein n=1 Tax=Arenibaculum pallidiluteum TaxID=2812559 RepID=UPI001A978AEA|nr:ribbon-helix-helix domain-containing protein [Arenibaculum pallidiluteum]